MRLFFVTRQILKKHEGEIWGCFIDLKAAYDWINRQRLLEVLRTRFGEGNGKVIVDLLECLYRLTTAKIDGSESEISIKIGLKQGAVESCVLFNYWLDTAMRFVLLEISEKVPTAGIDRRYQVCSENSTREQRMKHQMSGFTNCKFVKFADDILVLCKTKDELEQVMNIIAGKFEDFGMVLAETKTVTMTWNTSDETMKTESLISVNGTPLSNLREFKYLGHVLTNEKKAKFLSAQIGLAYGAWNELKTTLTDHNIYLKTRVRIAESVFRSRLTYALQTDRLLPSQRDTIDSIWFRTCRKMIRGGFRRIGSEDDENPNFKYVIKNEEVQQICKTQRASAFCEAQHLKFVGHVARMGNDAPQKQWMFADTRKGCANKWKLLGKDWNVSEQQIRKTISNKKSLNDFLKERI